MILDESYLSQHDQPCDCAVCDDIHFRRSLSIDERDRYREALQRIAEYSESRDRVWANDMKNIAREALKEQP